MGSRLRIRTPEDFVLPRDACSYGYFLLAPNRWDPARGVFSRMLDLTEGPVRVDIRQEGWEPDWHPPPPSLPSVGDGGRASSPRRINWPARGRPLVVRADRALSRAEQAQARAQIARMLRLDEDAEVIARFHKVDPRWRSSGRGRLFRSPTLFEDVVKTVTSCNVQWPGTIAMNERLCRIVGRGGAFPSPERLARTRPATLRSRCRVGYRDARLVELARLFAPRGRRPPEIDPERLEDPRGRDEELFRTLLALPGIGPYAAANVMQLLGRYARLPLDTESVRHGRTVLGFTGSDAQVMRCVQEHFAPFGAHTFRSYWFELWTHYETRRGWAHTWEREGTGATLTAAG